MNQYDIAEEAYKNGYIAGAIASAAKTEPPPVSFWAGKTVLIRETPVTILREVYCTYEDPYAEGYDDEGRYYKIPLDTLRLLEKPITGVVRRWTTKK